MERFITVFRDRVIDTVDKAGVSNFIGGSDRTHAVLTGGGARYGFLRDVFDEPLEVAGEFVKFDLLDATPARVVESASVDTRSNFVQLAVAMGGARPDLPSEVAAVTDTTVPERRAWSGNSWTG